MPAHRYMEENGLAAERSAGVAQDVNLSENVTHIPLPSMNKAAHSDLKPRGYLNRSPKQGYQCPTKRTYILKKNLKV